MLFCWCHSKT